MKVYHLPAKASALIFDMDLTLYSNEEYGRTQIDSLIEILAKRQGKGFAAMQAEVEAYRNGWAAAHDGERLSLSAAFLAFGVTMEENIRWREEAYKPELYLKADLRLRQTLERLSAGYALAVVTNNTVSIAAKTLALLGVADCFAVVVGLGLDTGMAPKPCAQPFLACTNRLGVNAGECVSIGDRYDIDLKVPLELGMGGILVDGVEDVYALGEVLKSR